MSQAVLATPEPSQIPIELAPEAHISAAEAPGWDELAARFRPIFARIAEGAIERERKRELAYEAVAWLRDARFGAVRIPKAYGGSGATLAQLFRLLLELAEADSNVSHLFRGHFAWLEMRLNTPEPEVQARWFPKVAEGLLIGYAMAEKMELAGNVKLVRENGELFIDGTKYYSTGTVYADWIITTVADGEEFVSAAVPCEAPGVTRIDDWDGFGQRLTGSGTTRFERVRITEDNVIRRRPRSGSDRTPSVPESAEKNSYQIAFLQLVLLASIAGAGKAALREGIAFVRPRNRTFNLPAGNGRPLPKDDPLVQRVIGKVSSLVYSAETHVLALAQHLEELYQLAQRGEATEADFAAVEVKAFQAQQVVIPTVLEATTVIFDVGGASATSQSRQFDRHWRNARTAASHNPAIQRERAIGDFLLNGVGPSKARRDAREAVASTAGEPSSAPSNGSASQVSP